jgi:hypothetical protein
MAGLFRQQMPSPDRQNRCLRTYIRFVQQSDRKKNCGSLS